MKTKQGRPDATRKSKSDAAAPLKRFRIVKLEERVAPRMGGKGTHNCSFSLSA